MQREEQGGRWLSKRADEMLGNKEGWEVEGGKRGSCVVSLYVKRLAELQSPLSEQVLTTWLPPPPLTLSVSIYFSHSPPVLTLFLPSVLSSFFFSSNGGPVIAALALCSCLPLGLLSQ